MEAWIYTVRDTSVWKTKKGFQMPLETALLLCVCIAFILEVTLLTTFVYVVAKDIVSYLCDKKSSNKLCNGDYSKMEET